MMIFGFLPQNVKTQAVAVACSIAWAEGAVEPRPGEDQSRDELAEFRRQLYGCFTARADELLELADGALCAGGPVRVLAELSLAPGHQRGHGALYDAVNCGRVDVARLRWLLTRLPLPAWDDGRIRLAVDVSNWLRPDAVTSPERLFCHCYGRGNSSAQMIPGWPYSFVAALEPGRSSWTRLAWLLADLPVQVIGRLGTNRVLPQPPPPREPGQMGRPARHGRELKLADEATHPGPDVTTTTVTTRYGTATARAWHRAHPRPVWLWTSRSDAGPDEVNWCWQAFLRRFDIEHTFRFLKQILGWTAPKLRDPAAAGRWTWLILACYAQLHLARSLAADLRLPWQRPAPAGRMTPARVRRGFRDIHGTLPRLAAAPKPGKPGPGRPPGSRNRHPATRHDVGKTTTKKKTSKTAQNQTG